MSRLHVEHHNSASGEYTCRCPAHDDRTASLTVNVQSSRYNGAPRIVFKCHAGCSEADVLNAMGLKVQDLRDDNTPPNGGAPRGMTVRQAIPTPPLKPEAAKPEKKPLKPLPPITKIYSYTDANGEELFQVTRHDYIGDDGKHAKTFRQRMYAPENKNAKKDGFVWSVPDSIKLHTLYRLPEVNAAIRDGRTVYVVEGEKDADTLARLGHAATTQPQGAGKWADSYSELLRGAHVVMLPGRGHRRKQLRGTGARLEGLHVADAHCEKHQDGQPESLLPGAAAEGRHHGHGGADGRTPCDGCAGAADWRDAAL